VSNRGSLLIPNPLAFTEELLFFINILIEKEGFFNRLVVYNK
jgi:hypothetical protein